MNAPVLDRLNRPLEALRISVTDRCNLRCTYCMPKAAFANHAFLAQNDLLSFDEIERLARVFINRGVRKIRLTGGEPLLRPHLEDLVARLTRLPGLDELALSTNGLLLAEKAEALRAAGLERINLSLDAIDDGVFGEINGLGRPAGPVLRGLDAALAAGLRAKVNMVVERGVNEVQILPMARHFAARGVTLRFIEFMDVGNVNGWTPKLVVSGSEIRTILSAEFELEPEQAQAAAPARASALSIRLRSRFAATATGCDSPPMAASSPVFSRAMATICASRCAAARATTNSRNASRKSGARGRIATRNCAPKSTPKLPRWRCRTSAADTREFARPACESSQPRLGCARATTRITWAINDPSRARFARSPAWTAG